MVRARVRAIIPELTLMHRAQQWYIRLISSGKQFIPGSESPVQSDLGLHFYDYARLQPTCN